MRTPLDRLAESVEESLWRLRSAAAQASRHEGAGREIAVELSERIGEMMDELISRRAEVQALADQTRAQYAIARAEELLLLWEAGALDRQGAYEMTEHTPHDVQERLGYPAELQRRLREDKLILSLLDQTRPALTFVAAGHFFP